MTRSGPYGRPAKVTCSAKLRCSVMVPSATAVAVEHVTLLAIHAPRLEQIVQTNPELVMALIRQLARMAALGDKCSGAVA